MENVNTYIEKVTGWIKDNPYWSAGIGAIIFLPSAQRLVFGKKVKIFGKKSNRSAKARRTRLKNMRKRAYRAGYRAGNRYRRR